MAVKSEVKKARDVVTDYLISYVGEKAGNHLRAIEK